MQRVCVRKIIVKNTKLITDHRILCICLQCGATWQNCLLTCLLLQEQYNCVSYSSYHSIALCTAKGSNGTGAFYNLCVFFW